MHIYFIGQKGFPAQNIEDSAELRTEALANEIIKNGDRITIASTSAYANRQNIRSHYAKLIHIPSLNPNVAGGYIYSLLSSVAALFVKPDTIHVQGWTSAIIVRLLAPFMPKTSLIWTISTLPEFSNSFLGWIFSKFLPFVTSRFDTVSTPNRAVQYRLLIGHSIKSEYIPDGYNLPPLPDIRPALFGLRKEQYCIVFSENIAQLKQIIATFKALKSKKKLIVFTSEKYVGAMSVNLPPLSRGAQSLVRQAAFIISANTAYSPLSLQAMDSGRAIIATTHPLNEELFGTTARYYEKNDSTQLQILLKRALKKHSLNTAAQLRAKNHFSWEKTGQEYRRAYRHSKTILVPFDSIVAKGSFQRAI